MSRSRVKRGAAGGWSIRTSRAGATQRSANAGLALDRADLALAADDRSGRGFSRHLPSAPTLPEAPDRLVGVVVDLDPEAEIFVIRIDDVGGSGVGSIEMKVSLALCTAAVRQSLAIGTSVAWDPSSIDVLAEPPSGIGSRPDEGRTRQVRPVVGAAGASALAAFAAAVNDGSLRDDIDAATGWDPELAV